MVKGIDLVNPSEMKTLITDITKNKKSGFAKDVAEIVKRDCKSIDEVPADALRAKYASQLDTPILSRFKHEPLKIPDFTRLPKEKQVELLTDTLKRNAPKTKEEALTRLDNTVSELRKMNVEVSEDMIQTLKNDIIKKFGG